MPGARKPAASTVKKAAELVRLCERPVARVIVDGRRIELVFTASDPDHADDYGMVDMKR